MANFVLSSVSTDGLASKLFAWQISGPVLTGSFHVVIYNDAYARNKRLYSYNYMKILEWWNKADVSHFNFAVGLTVSHR